MNIEKTIQSLNRRGISAQHFETRGQAADYLVSQIKDTQVGIGGSITVEQLDVYDRLSENNEVIWHWLDGASTDTARKAFKARVYLTSANAVAETGEIVNIDGRGNRVAATLYDKESVYIIVGTNKIAEDFDAAVFRARNIAAPKNAQRLNCNTPCAAKADKCYDCSSPDRICNGLAVIWGKMLGVGNLEVIIIDEELGY